MSVRSAVAPARTCEAPRALDLGIAVDNQGQEREPLRVPLSVLTGQVLVTGGTDEVARAVTRLLGQLSAAGIPWLRIGRTPARTPDPSAVAVVDLTDPRGIALTIDPFLPEPGYPEIAHADALSALLESVFGPPGPYQDVLAMALRGLYAARPPHEAAPATSQVERVALAAARELGYGKAADAALRGFITTRLGRLRGPATGMLLGGGHPADMAELLRRDIDLVTGDAGGAEGRALLIGAIALRVAEHACRFPRAAADSPRHVLVLEEAGLLPRGSHAALQVARLLGNARAHGTGVIIALPAPVPVASWLADGVALAIAHERDTALAAGPALSGPVTLRVSPRNAGAGPFAVHSLAGTDPAPVPAVPRFWPAAEGPGVPGQASVAGLIDQRTGACARSCRAGQSCARDEIAAAAALAEATSQEAAWLRLWATMLLLAFLVGHPLPPVPPPLRAAAAARRPRVIECALATIAERLIAERAPAIRGCFPVAALARALSGVAADMLAGRRTPGTAGQVWVIPQLRWAHEAARVGWAREPSSPDAPPGGTVRPGDLAPPLDFAIAGLADWTGILAQDRVRALLCHPLSLEAAPNRRAAALALFGELGQEALDAALATDLAVLSPAPPPAEAPPAGSSPSPSSAAEAMRLLCCDGDWLVTVMRWTSSG
jgi:hypothetical protein